MNEGCCLYVIEHADRDAPGPNMFKVGISSDPDARLRNLQTAYPYKLCVAMQLSLASREIARAIETRIHHLLRDVRHEGEWFEVDGAYALVALVDAVLQLKMEGMAGLYFPHIGISTSLLNFALGPRGDSIRQRRWLA